MPLEFEEAPEVDASARLVTVPCAECAAGCLAAPGFRGRPLCGTCRPVPAVARTEHYHPGGWSTRGPAAEPGAEKPPPPIVPGVGVEAIRVPAAVTSLADVAYRWGWSIKIMYSRGFGPKKWRGSWQEEELFSVRFGGHVDTGRQAYAVYRTIAGRATWMWRSVWVWGPDLPPFGMFGVTELRDYLEMAPTLSTEELSFACMVARAQKLDSATAAAARVAAAPKKSKMKEGAS
jgi:hypothetical protein